MMKVELRRSRSLLFAFCVLLPAACVYAGGQKEHNGAAAGGVVLHFMTVHNLPTFDAKTKAAIAGFESYMAGQGTKVRVDTSIFTGNNGDYDTKVILMLKSGQGSGVVVERVSAGAEFMRAGYLKPLNHYVTDWMPWGFMFAPFKKTDSYKGKVYQLSFQTASTPLFYRKDLFVKAGLSTNWQPKSWAELISAAERIKARLPGVVPLLLTGNNGSGASQTTFSRFSPLLHGAGGRVFDSKSGRWIVTSKPLLAVFAFYQEVAKKGLIDPSRAVSGDADQWSYASFGAGKGAIDMYGSWAYNSWWAKGRPYAIPNEASVVGYAKIPAEAPGKSVNGQSFVNQSGGWSYMIPATTSKRASGLAWDLIQYLSSAREQAEFNLEKGQVATRSDVIHTPVYEKDPYMATVSSWVKYSYLAPPIDLGWAGKPRTLIETAIGNIMVGNWTPAEAMKQYAQQMLQFFGKDRVEYRDGT